MDSTASSLLASLQRTDDYRGLFDCFTAFLLPFADFIPLDSRRPSSAAPKRRGTSTASAAGAKNRKKKDEVDPRSVRPLGKQFLPFLCQALKLLPALLRRNPKDNSQGGGGGEREDNERAAELLGVYGLALDCLACIAPCLVGKPYSVQLQRGRLVCCLEAWGRYAEAEEEALAVLHGLRLALAPAAPKSQRGKADPDSGCFLPDPKVIGADDPDVATLAIELIVALASSAGKSGTRDSAAYERILALVDQVQPWLCFIDPESVNRFHLLLVNALYRCSVFLAGECMHFNGDLVQRFCLQTLRECLKSTTAHRFPMIARKICSSIHSQWAGGTSLTLDMLRLTLESIKCGCKVGTVKSVNELLEFVSYCVDSVCADNIDIRKSVLKLLYGQGDVLLKVSPPIASILILYATGLYFKSSNNQGRQTEDTFQGSNDASAIMSLLDNGENLGKLTDSLGNLTTYFQIASFKNAVFSEGDMNESVDALAVLQESTMYGACKHLHGNASLISYLDALEFLCRILVEFVNTAWKHLASERETTRHSVNTNQILDALHQFCDLILAGFRCTKLSDLDRERLDECRGTLLQVAVSAFKISLLTRGNHQKSQFSINFVISSEWIQPLELKFLISALNNIGASLYNTDQFDQASIALQLCCEVIWTRVKLLSTMYSNKSERSSVDDISKDELKDVISDSFARISTIVDVVHKCGIDNTHDILVKSLYKLSSAADLVQNLTASLALVKQWVKMICKDFKNVDAMDNTPILYYSLLSYCPTWSKNIVGKILEEELLAYGLMGARNPVLCQKMQLKVIDILLNDIYTTKDYYFQRSRVFVWKGKVLRAGGIEGLSACIECLSKAVSVLDDIPNEYSQNNASVYHQMALTYCLQALCAQEANQDFNVILQNICCAVNLWSSIHIEGLCFTDSHLELAAENIIPLLCSIVDLLSLKGCLEFHSKICKLMIGFCNRENLPLEKCFAMLWNGRRLNHSLCTSPIDEEFILNMLEHLGVNVNSVDYWKSCLKGHPAFLCMFLQKLSLSDSVFPEASVHTSKRDFSFDVTLNEVKKIAISLLSDVHLASQSAFIAGCLFYDLSERLFSTGQIFEALTYAKEALRLRKKILRRKFTYVFEKQSLKVLDVEEVTQSGHDHVCLEAVGSVITEVWPDNCESSNLEDFILTPWSVLRCYLESTVQVGIIHESTGNGAEAEFLFQQGKRISTLQGLPIFGIAFTSLLGKLYRKKLLWDLAENELNNAKKLLVESDGIISCKHCKLAFQVSVDMQIGDLSRDLFGNGLQVRSTNSLPDALSLYRSSLEKLNHAESESSLSICEMPQIDCSSFGNNYLEEAKHGVPIADKVPSPVKEVKSTLCRICALLNQNSNVQCAGQLQPKCVEVPPIHAVGEGSLVNPEVKKRSKNASKREQNLNAGLKPRRTRSSNQSTENQKLDVSVEAENSRFVSHKLCPGTSPGQSKKKQNGSIPTDTVCYEESIYCRTCWRCRLIKVMEAGSMQEILHAKWECHRRRVVQMLLLKIARCLKPHDGKHGAHEVHDVFWQCIALLTNRKPFSQNNSGIPDSHLIELIVDESSGNVFSIERAAILYYMSWFSLKDCLSENSRTACCSLSNIEMANVVPWLLRAFILCREFPLLSQKVSRLLSCLFLLSTVDGAISLPLYSEKSLSLNHWAAYFHQASIGAHLHCQYLSCLGDKAINAKFSEGFSSDGMAYAATKPAKFLRFAPEKLEYLEEYVRNFFQSLPTVSIICISMLGGDYGTLLGETLLLPSLFPAWLLLSRLDGSSEPIVMILPADLIREDIQLEEVDSGNANMGLVKSWQCPWGHTVVDYVAPSFKVLLKENFLSLSCTTLTPAEVQINSMDWWSQRIQLDKRLSKLLKSMEESWLGPWGCLLLGEHSDPEYLGMIVPKLISNLKSHCKFEVNDSLARLILGGAKSVADAEACISQLLIYKGYFGRGACCGEERFRAFSASGPMGIRSVYATIHNLLQETGGGHVELIDREPVILVLDSDVQMLPWENLPILGRQEVYRMPSVGSIFLTLNKSWPSRNEDKAFDDVFPAFDPFDAYYLLNPSGDLNSTQMEFEEWFRNQKWEGKAGNIPTTEELCLALQNHDLFLYFGHGNGTQYISVHEIQKLERCAATVLMGCSSGSLLQRGCYAPRGAPISYLSAGCPAVIANLWDVTDKDIDRFAKSLLDSWLREESVILDRCISCNKLVKELGSISIAVERNASFRRTRRKTYRGKKLQQSCEICHCKGCGRKKIASFMSQARDACKLPLLIGASPVCYGVPTAIRKKSK